MKKKQTAALLVAGCMGLSLAACGGKTQENSTNKQVEASGSGLTVAIWDNAQLTGLKEIMGDFTNESGISAEIQVVPWDQ